MLVKKFRFHFLGAFLLVVTACLSVSLLFVVHTKAVASGWPLVRQSNTGENVYTVQYMLQAQGYSLTIDGDFGPQTKSAVHSFQSHHGLTADGEVGPQTWPVLIKTSSSGSKGANVSALQRQLNRFGASLTVDGDFGPKTSAAVKSYQTSRGLTNNGNADLATWNALVNAAPATSGSGSGPTTAPRATTSWYKTTLDSTTAQQEGCTAAGTPGLVVLDYGQPYYSGGTFGARLTGTSTFVSDARIQTNVIAFLNGAKNCASASTNLKIAVGTSNCLNGQSGSGCNNPLSTAQIRAAGRAWADIVNAAQARVGTDRRFAIYGANDIEIEWSTFASAKAFSDGFSSRTSALLVNYGDASDGANGNGSAYSWTAEQLWQIGSTGNNVSLPEIYYSANAREWRQLSEWSCNNKRSAWKIIGTMAENGEAGSLSPDASWKAMHDALAQSSNSCASASRNQLHYLTSIHQ